MEKGSGHKSFVETGLSRSSVGEQAMNEVDVKGLSRASMAQMLYQWARRLWLALRPELLLVHVHHNVGNSDGKLGADWLERRKPHVINFSLVSRSRTLTMLTTKAVRLAARSSIKPSSSVCSCLATCSTLVNCPKPNQPILGFSLLYFHSSILPIDSNLCYNLCRVWQQSSGRMRT